MIFSPGDMINDCSCAGYTCGINAWEVHSVCLLNCVQTIIMLTNIL